MEDKLAFERLRAEMRLATGFPVTQLGAFAVLVRIARDTNVGAVARAMLRE